MVAKGEGWRATAGISLVISCWTLCAVAIPLLLLRRNQQPIASRGWPLLFMGVLGVAMSPDLFLDEWDPTLLPCMSHYYLVMLSAHFFACPLILAAWRLSFAHKFEAHKRAWAQMDLTPRTLAQIARMRNAYSYPRLLLYFVLMFLVAFLGWSIQFFVECSLTSSHTAIQSGWATLVYAVNIFYAGYILRGKKDELGLKSEMTILFVYAGGSAIVSNLLKMGTGDSEWQPWIVYRVSQQFFVLNSVIRRSLQTWQGYREWENAFRMACCCFRCCRPRQYTPRETVPERSQTRSRSTMPSTVRREQMQELIEALEEIMSTELGFAYLMEHARREFNEESLLCLHAIRTFRAHPTPRALNDIVVKFLNAQAPLEVNIDAETRQAVLAACTQHALTAAGDAAAIAIPGVREASPRQAAPAAAAAADGSDVTRMARVFDPVEAELLRLLVTNSLLRFRKSELFTKYLLKEPLAPGSPRDALGLSSARMAAHRAEQQGLGSLRHARHQPTRSVRIAERLGALQIEAAPAGPPSPAGSGSGVDSGGRGSVRDAFGVGLPLAPSPKAVASDTSSAAVRSASSRGSTSSSAATAAAGASPAAGSLKVPSGAGGRVAVSSAGSPSSAAAQSGLAAAEWRLPAPASSALTASAGVELRKSRSQRSLLGGGAGAGPAVEGLSPQSQSLPAPDASLQHHNWHASGGSGGSGDFSVPGLPPASAATPLLA